MKVELQALEGNETWELIDLLAGKKPIGYRWIYKIKCKPDDTIAKYKARLVVKGYNQVVGVDYFDSFSHVNKTVTVMFILALAAAKKWHLHQLDVNNAFWHGFLEEEVYMDNPEGYEKAQKGQVCKLKRSLHGLKQVSRQSNLKFTSKLLEYDFIQSYNDNCMFVLQNDACFMVLIVNVDDILVVGDSEESIVAVKYYLLDQFTIKDLGIAKYFLGIEIARSKARLFVSQRKYIPDIVQDLKMNDAKQVATPLQVD
ncbi:transmembrane signal receptor [Lithospermum erythrorhizon]|uniref:Transmembrane signal receptor n=1 Tax=Lithospermum erythrorhizon TaxID=34254 RepID=A0AAV3QB92_LITER